MSVKYPFLNKLDKPIHNARELYAALSFASSGFFGVGGNNFWHGGLHFSKAMASKIALEKPVMCIGDGKVIAWRINKEYKTSSYKGMNLEYSTGFVLVQHTYEAKLDAANTIKLGWYSLYMHLLPYSEYENNSKLEKPFFYAEHSTFQSVSDKSRDTEYGRFLYTDNGRTFKEIIPPATIVDIEETENPEGVSENQTYTVKTGDTLYLIAKKYVSGGHRELMNFIRDIKQHNNLNSDFITPGKALKIPGTNDNSSSNSDSEYIKVSYTDLFSQKQTGYIKLQGSDQLKNGQIIIDSSASESKPERGVRMRESGSSRAKIFLVLPHGTKFQVVSETGGSTKWGKVVEVISDRGEYRGEYGYIYLPETRLLADPGPIYDRVVVPDKPVNIGAGTAVGYIGKYETPNTPNGNEQVHIEVFSGDDIEGFLGQSRAASNGIDVKKPIIQLPEGTSLYGLSNTQPDDFVEPMLGMKITTNDKQNNYVEVQITGNYGIVQRSEMAAYSNGVYLVNRSNIPSIQQALNSTKYAGTSLKLSAYVSDDKTIFSNTNQNTSGRYKYRLVFFKQSGKRVWIRRQDYDQLYQSIIDRLTRYGGNPIPAWSNNPLQMDEVMVDSVEYDVYTHESNLKKKQINNETWFEFEVEHPLGTNSRERGYAKFDVLKTYSANEWPGFNIVKETASSGMGFALNEDSQNNRFLDIDSVTPMFKKMLEHIDVDGDKTLTLNEVKNGNSRLSVREILPRLVIQHPSEWQAGKSLSKWNKLSELLASNPELLDHEKKRIKNLVWWDEVRAKADDFPVDPNVYHFHPIGFIENLNIDRNPGKGECSFYNVTSHKVVIYLERIKQWPKRNSTDPRVAQGGTISKLTIMVEGKETRSGYALEAAGHDSKMKGSDQRTTEGVHHLIVNPGRKGDLRLVQLTPAQAKEMYGTRSLLNVHTGNYPTDIEGCISPGLSWEEKTGSDGNKYPAIVGGTSGKMYVSLLGVIKDNSTTVIRDTYDGQNRYSTTMYDDAIIVIRNCFEQSSDEITRLSDEGRKLLHDYEKLVLYTYDDQNGKRIYSWVKGATIGYGHLIQKRNFSKFKNGITVQQADELFENDLAPFENGVVKNLSVKVTQQQFDALVILAFNIGSRALSQSSALKLVNDPQAKTPYSSLEKAWKAFNRSQGKVMPGLNNRRNSEWKVYTQGIYKR